MLLVARVNKYICLQLTFFYYQQTASNFVHFIKARAEALNKRVIHDT